MTTTGRRFWVEVSPRFAAPVDPPIAEGAVPRLTALAVAAGLDGSELDAELASVHRQRSSLAAYELGLIERKAALGARQPLPFAPVTRTGSVTDLLDEEEALQARDDFLPEEVAVLLGTSVPATRYHVDYALTLVRQLPAVWHALADQRIDESAARAIVKALKHQAASWGGPVDDAIIDALAGCGVGWAERGCGPSALHDRLLAALIAADPAAADRRRETSKRGADAVVVPTGDGLGELRLLHVDIADLELARAQVDAYARALKADGDGRPIGQIRIAVILGLIMRPWEERDPAVAHVTVNADLADLLLPDLEDLIPDGPTDLRSDEDETTNVEGTDDEGTDDEGTDDEATDDGSGDEATDDAATTGGVPMQPARVAGAMPTATRPAPARPPTWTARTARTARVMPPSPRLPRPAVTIPPPAAHSLMLRGQLHPGSRGQVRPVVGRRSGTSTGSPSARPRSRNCCAASTPSGSPTPQAATWRSPSPAPTSNCSR